MALLQVQLLIRSYAAPAHLPAHHRKCHVLLEFIQIKSCNRRRSSYLFVGKIRREESIDGDGKGAVNIFVETTKCMCKKRSDVSVKCICFCSKEEIEKTKLAVEKRMEE